MASCKEQLQEMLKECAKTVVYLKGVNLIKGKYTPQTIMNAVDDKNAPLKLGIPTLVFDKRDMDGQPIHLYFDMTGDSIRMHYEFRIETNINGASPMLFSDLNIVMHIKNEDNRETTENLSHNLLFFRPQITSGSKEWKKVDEFLAVKKALEKGNVYITWNGKIQWVDASTPEMQENLKKPDYKLQTNIEKISGQINIAPITPDTCSHFSMFDGVKNLLRWDYEIIDENKVYFKDPLKDDTIYFLPQEYRIKALPNNAPDMTTEIISVNGIQKVLMRFRIAPFVHPNAKRDAYDIFLRRKGKPYCEFRYGGYESADFKQGGEMADGKLYGKDGFSNISKNGDVEAAPESSFFIVLEAPVDGLVQLFQDTLMGSGIHIGDVVFKVYDGLENSTKQLDPIPVKLNLHKLTGIQPHVAITECKWPHYVAKITNTGMYPIEIGDAALSVLRREKNQVTKAVHKLKSNTQWPKTLSSGEHTLVELTDDQVKALKHRKWPFFWKVNEDYWTEFICEPHSIRLPDDSLKDVMEKTNESAAYEQKPWEVTITVNFNWDDHPDLTAVQVQIKNKFGLDEVITLTNDGEKNTKISMVPNLNAKIKTQLAKERVFEYRIKPITKKNSKNSTWSDWESEIDSVLFIYEEDITPTETA